MSGLIGFGVGFFLGGFAGLIVMAILNSRGDDGMDR